MVSKAQDAKVGAGAGACEWCERFAQGLASMTRAGRQEAEALHASHGHFPGCAALGAAAGNPEAPKKRRGGARGDAGQVREDQVECPFCRRHGCPAVGGSKRRGGTRYVYRKCSHCGRRFRTTPEGRWEEAERNAPKPGQAPPGARTAKGKTGKGKGK